MKKLLILSGKGGTGKTTVASAFIRFAEAKVFADCADNSQLNSSGGRSHNILIAVDRHNALNGRNGYLRSLGDACVG